MLGIYQLSLCVWQDLLNSLSYSYSLPEDEEPVAGERRVMIIISDGFFQSAIIISVDVIILNNNPPEISFSGSSNISFTEETAAPVALGSLLAPVISDRDDNDVFLMASAGVELQHTIDTYHEVLQYNRELVESLGIRVDGMSMTL